MNELQMVTDEYPTILYHCIIWGLFGILRLFNDDASFVVKTNDRAARMKRCRPENKRISFTNQI